MSIVSLESKDEKNISMSIAQFFAVYGIINILSKFGTIREGFSKNTYYRFLASPRTNWLRFTTLLSERIINSHIRPLTSENRDDCFVIDDSLYERAGFKRTEYASRVFDHVSKRYMKGFKIADSGLDRWLHFLANKLFLAGLKQG